MKTLFLTLILITTASYSQNIQNHIIIRDAIGDIQTRSVTTSAWNPLTAGLAIPSKSFIRLNSPDSLVTLSYPDGSTLRLIGIGSFFLEQISEAQQNIYHSKILVLSGRWFYQANPQYVSRFIANTDITTSVIEHGSGGGFFSKGTNEFVLLQGRGLISYRQKNIDAIVLDERQYVNFNIFDGFFQPKLATDRIFEQYIIFPPKIIQTSQQGLQNINLVAYNDMPYRFSYDKNNPQQKQPISKDEIQFNQLDPLQNLKFPRRADRSQVTIYQRRTNTEPKEEIFQEIVRPTVIPKELLEAINVEDFRITTNVKPPEPVKPPVKRTPIRRRPPRRTQQTRPEIIEESAELEPEPEIIEEPTVNLDDLINQINEEFNEENAQQQRNRRPQRTQPAIIIEEETPPVVEEEIFDGPMELEQEEEILEPPVVEEPPTPVRKKRRVRRRVPPPVEYSYNNDLYNENIPEESSELDPSDPLYKPPDGFFNRNLDDDAYRYDRFRLDSIDDLLDSDLSILLQG